MLVARNPLTAKSLVLHNDVLISEIESHSIGNAFSFAMPVEHFKITGKKIKNDISAVFAEKMGIIRFVSMVSIVWGHCLIGWETTQFKTTEYQIFQAIFMELGRIGTINFFIISGFFLYDKIQTYTVLSYLRHRFFTLILPWIIFLSLFVIIESAKVVSLSQLLHGDFGHNMQLCFNLATSFIFHSAYWFVPMSVFSAVILIICKKYIDNLWFGLLLAFITLFYCVNLYHGWVSVNHTKSVMGYTVFMWLGLQLKAKMPATKLILDKVSMEVLLFTVVFVFLLACHEGNVLMKLGSADAYASIRLTNVIISIFLFLALLKSENINWISRLNPRKFVYGIYLVHCIVICQLRPIMNYFIGQQMLFSNLKYSILIQGSFFVIIFALTYIIVDGINKTRFKFILGA